MGDKKTQGLKLFENYSSGVKTNRDAWCYNSSKEAVALNMERTILFYNREAERFKKEFGQLDNKSKENNVANFINLDPTLISWDHAQRIGVARERAGVYSSNKIVRALYRPFAKNWLYFDNFFNNRTYQIPNIFPDTGAYNRVIYISGSGNSGKDFSVLISDVIPDVNSQHSGGQGFPLYLYDNEEKINPIGFDGTPQDDLFDSNSTTSATCPDGYTRKDAITDSGLNHFQDAYPGEKITKEDLFYYIFGLLHLPDYRERYADNLSKELPRIPCVKESADFWSFSKAGRKLAELHLNYETVDPYPATINTTGSNKLTKADYRVEKMKYGKSGREKDLTTLIYNNRITLTDIPLEAYEYIVNGKPALDWVVERQCVKTDKKSGIVNDANDWAIETMKNPKYPLELFQRVITVSLETMKIVKSLPKLDIE